MQEICIQAQEQYPNAASVPLKKLKFRILSAVSDAFQQKFLHSESHVWMGVKIGETVLGSAFIARN